MSFYRHNNTGKYFIVLESQLEKVPTEPNKGDDIILPYRKEVSETVGINSENSKDFFAISKNYYESDNAGAEDPLSTVPDFQDTLLKTIASEEAKTSLETTSNSNMLGFRIKKGKLRIDPNDPEWPSLLNELSNNPNNSLINKSVSKLLAENNLNSPENPVFNPQGFNENKIVLGTIQYKNLGEHGPRKFPDVVQSSASADQITIEEMKKVGLNLLVAASGIDLTMTNASIGDPNVPSIVDNGLKIKFGSMKPTNVLPTVKPDYQNRDNNDSVFDNSNLVDSYGSPNNPSKPYTGTRQQLSSSVLFVKILALSVAFKNILEKFNITGKNIVEGAANTISRDAQKVLKSYSINTNPEGDITKFDPFDIPPLTFDFYLTVQAGFKQFFGLGDFFEIEDPTTANHAGKSIQTYGYISTFVRKLNEAINDLGITLTVVDPNQPSEAVFEKLKSNFAIKFIKIMSIIGEKYLSVRNTLQQIPGLNDFVSGIDTVPEVVSPNDLRLDPGVLITKNKLISRFGSSAYGNTTLQSLLLVPEDIVAANASLTGENSVPMEQVLTELTSTNRVITNPSNDRISQEEIKKMEDYLEMDYMPFYFHDLRTNEIISFHAFLESATDQLSAEYNETEGYGRTGVIPIYKNTKRTISFNFKVLAVSEFDHEQMWYKINRLAMCLYPQYSEGRLLNYQGNKFIQPFSQVFAASPMMRIRFGDLWKSNYSKLAVARLFGLAGQNDGQRSTFQLSSTRQISGTPSNQTIRARQQERNEGNQTPREFQEGDTVEIRSSSGANNWPLDRQPNRVLAIPSGHIVGRIIGTSTIQRGQRRGQKEYLISITNSRPNGSGQLSGFIVTRANFSVRNQQTRNQNIGRGEDPINSVAVVAPSSLRLVPRPPEQVDAPDPETQTERVNNSIPDFFRADGNDPNPIMKAFASTEGKGLACFIRSMNFDSITDFPWSVERFDGRAPQLLNISMEITPIHDINPGLDSKGFMTAPIWPTGTIVNNVMGNETSSVRGRENFNLSRQKYLFSELNRLKG